jgi:hypothetical protein
VNTTPDKEKKPNTAPYQQKSIEPSQNQVAILGNINNKSKLQHIKNNSTQYIPPPTNHPFKPARLTTTKNTEYKTKTPTTNDNKEENQTNKQ